ncbi:WxL domain-containing protein [Latilactobacillus sakei]
MTLNKRNIIFSLLLVVMGLQLVVTTGVSLAESSIQIDSDLALTPDQELSNEKQIVIKVSDKAKTQRDLSLTVPAGATFDSTATEKLNRDPTYSLEFDSKDKAQQITLKALIKNKQEKTTTSNTQATTKTELAMNSSLEPMVKKDYLLVFKIVDSMQISNQELKITTSLEGNRYESKPLNFESIPSLREDDQVRQGDAFSKNLLASRKVILTKFPKDWAQPRGLLTSWPDNRLIIVPPNTSELSDDYSFYPRYTEGKTKVYLGSKLLTGQEVILFPDKIRENGGIKVKYAGYYQGKVIDITINVGDTRLTSGDNWNSQKGQFYFGLKPPSGSGYPGSEGFLGFRGLGTGNSGRIGAVMPLTYTFTDHATGQPVSLGGYFTWADIDYEAYRLKNSDVDYVATQSNTVVNYGEDSNYFHFYASGLGDFTADIGDKKEWGQFFFSNKSKLNIDIFAPYTVNGFTSGSLIKVNFPTISPIVYGDEEDSNLNDQVLDYRAIFEVPYRYGELGYPDKYEGILNYETVLNDPRNVIIKRQADGANVTYLFDVSISNGQIKLTAKNPRSENFYANVYEVKYSTTVKDGQDLSGYYSEGKYKFPITGEVDTGDGKEHRSNIDYATIVAPKPKLKAIKRVKNLSTPDSDYAEETKGRLDDELSYQLMFISLDSKNEISAGTVIEDVLDKNLASPNEVNIEYLNVDGSIKQTETTRFNSDGKLKLSYAIPKAGHVILSFKTKIVGSEKEIIENITKVNIDGNNIQSNNTKVTLPTRVIPTVLKDVRNISNNETEYSKETAGITDDEIEYRVMAINTTDNAIAKDTLFSDVLDDDLIQESPVKVEYYNMSSVLTDTEEVNLQNGKFKLSHEIVPFGHIRVYIKAKIGETNKTVINNTARVADGKSDVAKVNIEQGRSRIVVRYRDRKDESHKLAEDEIFGGKIGDTKLVQPKVIPETDGNWTVVDSSNMTNPDWGSTTKPDWTLAHDYTVTYAKDEQVITYRYEESHIGIIADKRWDFGQHDTTAIDRNYYLKAKTQDDEKQPYEVGVEDYYTSKGWTLNVKQDDQFHTNANEKIGGSQKFLDNAVLNFHNGQIALKESDDIGSTAPVSKLTSEFELVPEGASVNLMTHTNKKPDPGYYAAHGFGIWAYQFGNAQQADYSIGLKVPKATKRFPRQYTSQLTWSLVIAE